MLADHRKGLLSCSCARRSTDARANNALHPSQTIHPPCAHVRDELGYTLRICIPLGLLHQQPRHGYAGAGTEVSWGFVRLVELDETAGPHEIFCAFGMVIVIVCVLRELGLQLTDFFLEFHDVESADLLAASGVEILAYGTGTLTGKTSGESGVASCFALQGHKGVKSVRVFFPQPQEKSQCMVCRVKRRVRACRQRQHAVRVCAMRCELPSSSSRCWVGGRRKGPAGWTGTG